MNLQLDSATLQAIPYQQIAPNDDRYPYYKVLSYFAQQFTNSLILDIGTQFGSSAAHLAIEPSNEIRSYDITNRNNILNAPENIKYFVQDAKTIPHKTLRRAALIFLDISPHDGDQERKMCRRFDAAGFSGILILHDIRLSKEMVDFFSQITRPKWELEPLIKSCGVVDYSGQLELIIDA